MVDVRTLIDIWQFFVCTVSDRPLSFIVCTFFDRRHVRKITDWTVRFMYSYVCLCLCVICNVFLVRPYSAKLFKKLMLYLVPCLALFSSHRFYDSRVAVLRRSHTHPFLPGLLSRKSLLGHVDPVIGKVIIRCCFFVFCLFCCCWPRANKSCVCAAWLRGLGSFYACARANGGGGGDAHLVRLLKWGSRLCRDSGGLWSAWVMWSRSNPIRWICVDSAS